VTLWFLLASMGGGAFPSHQASASGAQASSAADLQRRGAPTFAPLAVRLWVLLALVATAAACGSDADCGFNGLCSSPGPVCACFPGWRGPACSQLALQDTDPGLGHPWGSTLSSWGGLPLQDDNGGWFCCVFRVVVPLTTATHTFAPTALRDRHLAPVLQPVLPRMLAAALGNKLPGRARRVRQRPGSLHRCVCVCVCVCVASRPGPGLTFHLLRAHTLSSRLNSCSLPHFRRRHCGARVLPQRAADAGPGWHLGGVLHWLRARGSHSELVSVDSRGPPPPPLGRYVAVNRGACILSLPHPLVPRLRSSDVVDDLPLAPRTVPPGGPGSNPSWWCQKNL
jgi:hypothetical protein